MRLRDILARAVVALERIADSLEQQVDAGDEIMKPHELKVEPRTVDGWRRLADSTKRKFFIMPTGAAYIDDEGVDRVLIIMRADGQEAARHVL
jgi:hypothetical protein